MNTTSRSSRLPLFVGLGILLLTFVLSLAFEQPALAQPVETPAPTATPEATPPPNRPVPTFLPALWSHYRPQAPILGVALQGYYDAVGYPQALALNVRWVRRWQWISWLEVEQQEGQYQWDRLAGLEEELRRSAGDRAEPYISVQMTPPWALASPGNGERVDYCGAIHPDKLEAFARFMEELVRRYGTQTEFGVRYWQLGNEPDIDPDVAGGGSPFGCWGDFDDEFYGGRAYGEMLKVVYPRIKAADPGARIVAGALLLECDPTWAVGSQCINEDRRRSGLFLRGILEAGAADFFDLLSIHSYGWLDPNVSSHMRNQYRAWSAPQGGTGLPQKVAWTRGVLAEYGAGNKPIFLGEVALKCGEAGPDCEETGAAYIPRIYAEAYGLGVVGATYYALITEGDGYKGLIREDLSPKLQYQSYRFLGGMLHGVEHVGPVTTYPGVEGQSFKQSEVRRLQIIWSVDGLPQTVTPPPDFERAYDVFGNLVAPAEGKLTVDWSPLYLELRYRNQPTR